MKEDRSTLLLLNLSQLCFLFFPLLGIFAPLLIWKTNKEVKGMEAMAKAIINFQITWIIFSTIPVFLALFGGKLLVNWKILLQGFIISYALLYAYNLIMIGINSVKCYQGKKVNYFPAIPFLKK